MDSQERTQVDRTRRALIHAAWIVPAIIAVKLPTNVFGYPDGSVSVGAEVGVTTPIGSAGAGAGVTVTPSVP